MSEFSFPPNTNSKKTEFSSLLLSDLYLFCSFTLSHPLYFSYFIFFSPYIVKILSFLSPLFITTFLLLLALFTTLVNDNSNCLHESSEFKASFLLTTYHNVLEKLRSNAGDGNQEFEDLEAYKIVFEESTLELLEQQGSNLEEEPVDKYPSHESCVSDQGHFTITNEANESSAPEIIKSETLQQLDGGKTLEGLLKENDDESVYVDVKGEEEPSMESRSEAIGSKLSQVKVENADHNGIVEHFSKVRSNSERLGSDFGVNCDNGEEFRQFSTRDSHRYGVWGEYGSKFTENSQPLGSNSIGGFGSMRKEKEWKRTLACKLFEERHSRVNVDGGGGAEGMDLLWETYETDSKKMVLAKSKTKKGKKGGSGYYDDEEEEEEEGELDNGQLCCLQALKFSAGKMNLGMGRPKSCQDFQSHQRVWMVASCHQAWQQEGVPLKYLLFFFTFV